MMKYILALFAVVLMSGCSVKEMENRDYVMAIAIEKAEQYNMTLSVASLDTMDKDSNGTKEYIVTGTGDTIQKALENANSRTKGEIYLGHCRTIALPDNFESYGELLDYVKGNIDLSRDVVVVKSQYPSKVIQLKNNETMASDYIYSYFEGKESVDINDIMDKYSNGNSIELPIVIEENNQIYIK